MVSCADYREEQRLLAINRRLAQMDLPAPERETLQAEALELEKALGMRE